VSKRKTLVYVTVRDCGFAFGCVGQIRSARTGEVLRETALIYPYSMAANAMQGAITIANREPRYTLSDKKHHRES